MSFQDDLLSAANRLVASNDEANFYLALRIRDLASRFEPPKAQRRFVDVGMGRGEYEWGFWIHERWEDEPGN